MLRVFIYGLTKFYKDGEVTVSKLKVRNEILGFVLKQNEFGLHFGFKMSDFQNFGHVFCPTSSLEGTHCKT